MIILKWTNKFSGETGYVGKVSVKAGHFTNAETKESAKTYKTENMAKKDIERLTDIGEAENNIFTMEEV